MKKCIKLTYSLVCSAFAISFAAIPAYAYIDPSAITYTVQAVAGIVIAAGSAIVIFRHKLAALFRKLFGKKDANVKKEIHLKDESSEGTDIK